MIALLTDRELRLVFDKELYFSIQLFWTHLFSLVGQTQGLNQYTAT